MLKGSVIIFVGMFAAAIFAPQVLESANSSCDAVERRIIATEMQGDVGALLANKLSGGSLAMQAAQKRHPGVPTIMACSMDYWQLVVKRK
jgi:hypothetical protein